MAEEHSIVAEPFDDVARQHETAQLGMWTFLATEILFFGALFLAYYVYRHFYFNDFAAASRHTDLLFGTVNSIIILTSSFTMALAVHAAKENYRQRIVPWLLATIALGTAFLVVKGFEYHKDITDQLVPGAHFNPSIPLHGQIFFWLYWTMTGLHAVHLSVGIGVLSVMTLLARKGKFSGEYYTPLELAGLYWHFVDIIWLFLYPLLYLVQRHS